MKRSGLSDSTLTALREQLPNLLEHRSPRPDTSDWVCVFCDNRPRPYQSHIEHDPACLGIQIQNDLDDSE